MRPSTVLVAAVAFLAGAAIPMMVSFRAMPFTIAALIVAMVVVVALSAGARARARR